MHQVIEYALYKLIESLDDKNDESSNIIRESAKRAKEIFEHIRICNVEYGGMSFEDFVEQLKLKPNIYLLSNTELEELEKLKAFQDIMVKHGFVLGKQ